MTKMTSSTTANERVPQHTTPRVRKRRIQERTEVARASIIAAATPMFAEQGFDAISVRDIETAAEVKRGMLSYHFESKDNLWKVVADEIFANLVRELDLRLVILKDLPKRESVALLIRFHVRYYSEHPVLSRFVSQEARQDTWRIEYLATKHQHPSLTLLAKHITESLDLSEREFAHWYYIMVSASATIFSFEPECRLLFGFSSYDEGVVEEHAEMMVNMLLGKSEDR